MISKTRKTPPRRILVYLYLVGLPVFVALSHYGLSRPGASVDTMASWLIPLKCPVKWLTGFLCPTCGLGRSFLLSLNGQFSEAIEYHFLGPLVALVAVLAYIHFLLPQPYRFSIAPSLRARAQKAGASRLLALAVAVYCLWGLGRNFPVL